MKISLCFSGNLRFIDNCYPNIKKYLLDDLKPDIYAHFWWDNEYQGKIFRFHSADRFEKQDLGKYFCDLYKPKNIILEPQGKFIDVYTGGDNDICKGNDNILWGQINYFNQQSQYYSKMKATELCVQSGIKYDYIIHLRTDAVIENNNNILQYIKQNKENKIFIASTMEGGPKYAGHHPNLLTDWFFFGNPQVINLFTYNLYHLLKKYRKDKLLHIQDYIYKICDELNQKHIRCYKFNSETSILRPKSMFNPDPLFVSPDKYNNNFDFKKKKMDRY